MPDNVLVAVLILLGLALFGGFAWKVLSPLGAIWRGDASRVPRMVRVHPQARTYLPFSLWAGTMSVGMCLGTLAVFVDVVGVWHRPKLLVIAAFGVFYATGPLLLVNMFAWAFNRPRFLIVPAYRSHPGWVRTTARRSRAKAEQFGARRRRSRPERL
jgi:hypothetical protein